MEPQWVQQQQQQQQLLEQQQQQLQQLQRQQQLLMQQEQQQYQQQQYQQQQYQQQQYEQQQYQQQYEQQQHQPHVPPPLASQNVYEYHGGAAQRTAPDLAAHAQYAQHTQPLRQPPLQPKRGVPPPPSMPPHAEAPMRPASGGAWQGGPEDHEIVEIVDVHANTRSSPLRPGSARNTPSSARTQDSPGRQASPGPLTATQAIQEVDYLVDLLRPTNEREAADALDDAAAEAAAEDEAAAEEEAAAARDYVQQVCSRDTP